MNVHEIAVEAYRADYAYTGCVWWRPVDNYGGNHEAAALSEGICPAPGCRSRLAPITAHPDVPPGSSVVLGRCATHGFLSLSKELQLMRSALGESA